MKHHPQRIAEEERRVRVAIGVGERMVLPMQDGVPARRQVRGPLHQVGEQVQYPFGARLHGEHLVRGVPMLEEALKEDARNPVTEEEDVEHQASMARPD